MFFELNSDGNGESGSSGDSAVSGIPFQGYEMSELINIFMCNIY